MVKAILASATPERDDRLFPGDIAQFSDGGGLGLAYGAAGVLYALAETGADRYEEGERWLLDHTDPVPTGTPLGLYDGLAGVAYVLDLLGHRQRALDLVDIVLRREVAEARPPTCSGGLAGLGLVLDRLARTTGEPALRDRGRRRRRGSLRRAGSAEPRPEPPKRRAGLLRGASGPALFLLRLYERDRRPRAARRGRRRRCGGTWSAASSSGAAAWRSTRAGGPCPTSATAASGSAWSSTTTCATGRDDRSSSGPGARS